jgi:hypothetical protein
MMDTPSTSSTHRFLNDCSSWRCGAAFLYPGAAAPDLKQSVVRRDGVGGRHPRGSAALQLGSIVADHPSVRGLCALCFKLPLPNLERLTGTGSLRLHWQRTPTVARQLVL